MAKQDKRQKRAKEKRARQNKQKQIEARNVEFDTEFLNDEFTLSQPDKYFGYNRERLPGELMSEFPVEDMLCMVSIINEQNIVPIMEETNLNFELGQWFLSEKLEHDKHVVHGPFDEIEAAFDFGRIELGVVSYRAAPVFDELESVSKEKNKPDYQALVSNFDDTMGQWYEQILQTHNEYGYSFDYEELEDVLLDLISREFPKAKALFEKEYNCSDELVAEINLNFDHKWVDMLVVTDKQSKDYWCGDLEKNGRITYGLVNGN
jgi:hypothetical protein